MPIDYDFLVNKADQYIDQCQNIQWTQENDPNVSFTPEGDMVIKSQSGTFFNVLDYLNNKQQDQHEDYNEDDYDEYYDEFEADEDYGEHIPSPHVQQPLDPRIPMAVDPDILGIR